MDKREARRVALRLAARALQAWEATEESWHDDFPAESVASVRVELLAISDELALRSGEPTSAAAQRHFEVSCHRALGPHASRAFEHPRPEEYSEVGQQ